MHKDDSKSVKKEAVIVLVLAALVVGFLAGIIYSAFNTPTALTQLNGTQSVGTKPSQNKQQEDQMFAMLQRLDTNPNDIDALIKLGDLYYDNNRFQEGIEIFLRAEKIDPKNIHVLNDLGILYMNTGKYEAALAKFETVLELDPSQNHSLYHVGVILREQGNKEKALNAFEKVLELNPSPDLYTQVQQAIAALKGELEP